MESIIIWIVIIVAGYVFEQLKKRAEQKKAEEEVLDRHSHMAKSRSNAPASHPRETDRPRESTILLPVMHFWRSVFLRNVIF